MTTTTLADRLAKALPCQGPFCGKHRENLAGDFTEGLCGNCQRRPAVLALIEAVRRETIEECAFKPFDELRADALNPQISMEHMHRWNRLSPGALWMKDAILALKETP
jgi:hypothetical protein